MPGIRVHHPMFHGGTFVVEAGKEYGNPYECGRCRVNLDGSKRVHYRKTHHIDLDEHGNGIVSEGVLEALRSVGMAGLEVENEVKAPPTLTIGSGPMAEVIGEYVQPRRS